MAVRLQMKLGVVAEHDRLPDSPDTLVVVEPSVGSVARSKGHLYLLVTSRISSRHAPRGDAPGRRDDPQRVLLRRVGRASGSASRRRSRPPTSGSPTSATGSACAARTATARSASASPSSAAARCTSRRSARPRRTSSARRASRRCPTRTASAACRRASSSPTSGAARSRSATRSCSCRPNVIAKLGADELKDAMLTLHPQSAMEHLHHRFVAADGSGQRRRDRLRGDRGRRRRAERGRSSRSGPPSRSPARPTARRSRSPTTSRRPASRRQRGRRPARRPRPAARSSGSSCRVQDLLPRRKPAYRRVTPLASRRETQRRAALALLALVVVVGGLGLGVSTPSAAPRRRRRSARSTPARRRSTRPGRTWPRSPGRASTSSTDDPSRRCELLTDGLRAARRAPRRQRVQAATIAPLREQAIAGLDRLYGVVPVALDATCSRSSRPRASRRST